MVFESMFPVTIFTDHNPNLFLFTRKGNLTPRQHNAQMLLTKFSNLQIILTAGTNFTVADMLSRDFSTIIIKKCQLQHKTLPSHVDFLQIKNDIISKTNSLFGQTWRCTPYTNKNDSHLILVDYYLRIQDKGKGNTVTFTSWFFLIPFCINILK